MIVGLLGPKPVALIVVNTIIVIISSRNACTGREIRIDEAPKHHCVVQCTDADGMCADMRAALGAIRRVVWHPQMWQI